MKHDSLKITYCIAFLFFVGVMSIFAFPPKGDAAHTDYALSSRSAGNTCGGLEGPFQTNIIAGALGDPYPECRNFATHAAINCSAQWWSKYRNASSVCASCASSPGQANCGSVQAEVGPVTGAGICLSCWHWLNADFSRSGYKTLQLRDFNVCNANPDTLYYKFYLRPVDVVIDSTITTNGTMQAGQNVTFSATARNIGNAATNDTSTIQGNSGGVHFYLDAYTPDQIDLGTPGTTNIPAGNTQVRTSNSWLVTSGPHTISACSDANTFVPESNESNNCTTNSFCAEALPTNVSSPGPLSGATNVSPSSDLSWAWGAWNNACATPQQYRVDFGTTNPPSQGTLATYTGQAATYDPGVLANSTTYYWRIMKCNGFFCTTGSVWSFTTAAAAPVGIDLDALDISPSGPFIQGNTVNFTTYYQNSGNTSTGVGFNIDLLVCRGVSCTDFPNVSRPALGGGSSTSYTWSNWTAGVPGGYFATFTVDPSPSAIAELNETNNDHTILFEVLSAPLSATCSANTQTSFPGRPVTWTADASGGVTPYAFTWSGDAFDSDVATGCTYSAVDVDPNQVTGCIYNKEGRYTADVSVRDSSSPATQKASCGLDVSVIRLPDWKEVLPQ